MHIIQHFLGSFVPNLVVTGMAKEPHADDDVTLQGEALLGFHKGVLEAGAAAQSDDWIFADHSYLIVRVSINPQNDSIKIFHDNSSIIIISSPFVLNDEINHLLNYGLLIFADHREGGVQNEHPNHLAFEFL